jgi:hypothetical protein
MKEFVRFFSSRVDTGCTDFVVIVLALCVVQIYGTDGLSTDGLALLDFKNGLTFNNILESWNASDVSPCNWEGVVCSGSDGLVTSLLLFDAGLYGSISPSLGKLQGLKQLHLSANLLTGEIPVELASCTKLTTLALDNNMLDGSIPAAIGKLQALQNLDLSTNNLTGEIPGELASCTNLKVLKIQSNQLTGSIPPGIYNISNLSGFYINNNNLTGNITEGMWTVCLGASSLSIVFFYLLNECLQLNLLPSTSPSNTFFCWERSCKDKKVQNFGVVFVFPEKTSNGPSFCNLKGSM